MMLLGGMLNNIFVIEDIHLDLGLRSVSERFVADPRQP